jgi:hypothetical protein
MEQDYFCVTSRALAIWHAGNSRIFNLSAA